MSKPRNPLDFYRSFSYHHILVACDSTETAENLATSSDTSLYNHVENKRFCPRTINGGRYVVLINGLSDSIFTIKSAKWTNVLMPNDVNADGAATNYRSFATDGELIVAEPQGVNFLNVINEITKMLGIDASGVVYALKTIFVGHRDDGVTVAYTTVRALTFILLEVTATFDATGSEYVLSFVGTVNGIARLPHVSTITSGFSYDLTPLVPLSSALAQLQVQLNEHYARQRDALKQQIECNQVEADVHQNFVDVKYEIEWDEVYNDNRFICGTETLAQALNTGNGDPIIHQQSNSISVEGLIAAVMDSCGEVRREAMGQSTDGHTYIYKITSALDTKPDEYVVKYQVQRFVGVVMKREELEDFKPDGEGEGIVFDYIFTGKNIDIKDFDIKMQFGMTFLQTLSAASSFPRNARNIINSYNPTSAVFGTGTANINRTNATDHVCEYDARASGITNPRVPLFLGTPTTSSTIRNTRYPGAQTGYFVMLARHAAYEALDVKMTIRGNPQLLEDTTLLSTDVTTSQQNRTQGQMLYSEDPDAKRAWSAIHKIPAYVKVNVFMPNVFKVQDFDADQTSNYASNFWYDGWYYVYSITHMFDGGEFLQEIEMFSLPVDDGQSKLNNSEDDPCASETTTTGQSETTQEPNTTGESSNRNNGSTSNPATSAVREVDQIRATRVDKLIGGIKSI